ncbi:SET domain-containing protein-lysine N-methyltransferase [Actinomadura sp. 3N508]|uniref:SET domain-containing protein-lysine N-methyltransferase n=1 Tax=Actinomadura sp. 3N508 TaxID=3375153 RepID=UPI00378B2215
MAIRQSAIHGTGAFAVRPISQGEIVAVRAGSVVSYEEARRRDAMLGGFSMQVEEGLFLCPDTANDLQNIAVFLNHSCAPNVGIRGQISFVALCDIRVNEELTFDYAMNVSFPYAFTCHCGADACRGRVTGDDWRDPALQRRYQGFFDAVITQKLNQWPTVGEVGTHRPAVPHEGPVFDRICAALDGFDLFDAWRDGEISRSVYAQGIDSVLELPSTLPLNENERALSARIHWRPGPFVDHALRSLRSAGGLQDTDYDWREFRRHKRMMERYWQHDGRSTYIFPEEARLIFAVAQLRAASNVVFLGSYYAYWASFVIAALAGRLRSAVLVDTDPEVCALSRRNLERLGLSAGVRVVEEEAIEFLRSEGDSFDLVVLDAEGPQSGTDPRYLGKAIYGPIVEALAGCLAPDGACLIAHNVLLENTFSHPYFDELCARNRSQLTEFLNRAGELFSEHALFATTEGVGVYWS